MTASALLRRDIEASQGLNGFLIVHVYAFETKNTYSLPTIRISHGQENMETPKHHTETPKYRNTETETLPSMFRNTPIHFATLFPKYQNTVSKHHHSCLETPKHRNTVSRNTVHAQVNSSSGRVCPVECVCSTSEYFRTL